MDIVNPQIETIIFTKFMFFDKYHQALLIIHTIKSHHITPLLADTDLI